MLAPAVLKHNPPALPTFQPCLPAPACPQVMCDVLDAEHVPHETNSRAKVRAAACKGGV